MAIVAFVLSLAAVCGLGTGAAFALAPVVAPYGEVARFGGLDTGATYSLSGSYATTGLPETAGEQAKFVYPLAMAVDTADATVPDEYSIFVLENTNPQALDQASMKSDDPTSGTLEYRIQKISDTGALLARAKFSLTSSATEPGLHAVSLAVDGPADRVYVLLQDVPPTSTVTDNTAHKGAVVAIDAWTAEPEGSEPALKPAVDKTTGIDDDLSTDSRTGGGELAGPGTLQGTGSSGLLSDIDGANIAVYGQGINAEIALGGSKYTSAKGASTPVIDLIKTAGPEAGKIEPTSWGGTTDIEDTENVVAKDAGQNSTQLYSLSSNSSGSLNVSLGKINGVGAADLEPNMATIGGSDLSSIAPLLPSGYAAENFITEPTVPNTNARYNVDAAATVGFSQDMHEDGSGSFMPSGSTLSAGTLAPSVVPLTGGSGFPTELYAGLIAHTPTEVQDQQNPTPEYTNPETPPSWKFAKALQEETGSEERKITEPASLGIRIFDAQSESLAFIGDVTSGGACNLQGSPDPAAFHDSVAGEPSFVALAPGREGVLFALVQPDLLNKIGVGELINPAEAVGVVEGDQIVEFAPGADSVGAGENASKWTECPQPEGSFSVTNETATPAEPPSTGTGEVAVLAGTKLKFGSEVNLRGGSPWAYDWDLEGGVNSKGEGPLFDFPWTVRNTFAIDPETEKAYTWPLSTVEAEFNTPGEYKETLNLVNDFGTLTSTRTLHVVAAGKIEDVKVTPAGEGTEGVSVSLSASATLPAGDKVKDYHWEFGDGEAEDTGEHAQVEHPYAAKGTYTVKVKITDALGQTAEGEGAVTVKEAEKPPVGSNNNNNNNNNSNNSNSSNNGGSTTATTSTTTTPTTPTSTSPSSKPLTSAQKLALALKSCKKQKSKKKRASCEKAAKTKYAPKPKKRKRKKT